MSIEVQSLPRAQSEALKGRLRDCKASLADLKTEFKTKKYALGDESANRTALMGDFDGADMAVTSRDQRDRMLEMTRRQEQTSQRLGHIKTMAVDMEDQGAQILGRLG